MCDSSTLSLPLGQKYSMVWKNRSSPEAKCSSSISFITSWDSNSTSPSSAIRKAGSRPMSSKLLRSTNRQKLSIVVIWALWIIAACLCRCSFPPSSLSFFKIAWLIRSRISAAAALVKVTTSSLSISTGFSSRHTIFTIRSESTAVLPLPAAADTNMLQSCKSIACCCSGVNFTAILSPCLFLYHFHMPYGILCRIWHIMLHAAYCAVYNILHCCVT